MADFTLPDLTNRQIFPLFDDLPLTTDDIPSHGHTRWLLGRIKENMTITNPTLICTDLRGKDWAVTFANTAYTLPAFKKGRTMIAVRNALRTPGKDGKKGYIRIRAEDEGNVVSFPASMDNEELVALMSRGTLGTDCWSCEEGKGKGEKKCTGCGYARYCSKECQVDGWERGGHKKECKTIARMREIWGPDKVKS